MKPKKEGIQAVIFDMDGVLIDAKDWHYEALNKALNLFGYNISRYDHLVTFDGLPTREKLKMLTREQQLSQSLHPLINELKQIYTEELIHLNCKPRFQHEYALSNLKANGYSLGLASNAIHKSVQLMMTKSNLLRYFDVVISNEDVTQPKPNPEIYQKAISNLKILPNQCLVVEDNSNGIKAAREAGAHVMTVQQVTDVTYDAIVDNIKFYNNN